MMDIVIYIKNRLNKWKIIEEEQNAFKKIILKN